MQKFKKSMVVALATIMAVGGSFTAFAEGEEPAAPATSGSTTGTGTSEGHVDKHVTSVTLPTIQSGSTPFAYTMDLERLIQETSGGKYTGTTFPQKDSDTGVYFLSATNTYTNTSEELTVTSESSADVKLTVDVEVESADTDIPLVDNAPGANATEPQLYLALKVGDVTKAVKKGEKVSADVTITGVPSNFKTAVENGKYVYSAIESSDTNFKAWNTSKISMTGAASKASAEGLTAPTLKVTWSWTDPAAGPSLTQTSYTKNASNSPIEVTVNNLKDDTIKSVINNGSELGGAMVTISGNKVTLTSTLLGYINDVASFKIVTTAGKELTFTVSPQS